MRRTKEDAAKTREAILDAAVKNFSQKGVAATTLSEIANDAGVTRGAIYWHFENKLDIFDALHERIYNPLYELLNRDIEENHPQPLQRLEEICVALLVRVDTQPQLRKVLNLFWLKFDYDVDYSLFQEKHITQKLQGRGLYFRLFTRAKEQGTLPTHANPKALTLSLGCFIKGIIIEHLTDPNLFDLQKDGKAMVEQFFRGLKKKR